MFAGPSQSFADSKLYPGLMCQRWNESGDPSTYLHFGSRFNPSTTQTARFDCPGIRDRAADIQGSKVTVVDRNPNDDVCVQVVGAERVGGGFAAIFGPKVCTISGWQSNSAVMLRTGGLSNLTGNMHMFLSVSNIPTSYSGADSGVVSYSFTEYNGTD